VAVAVVALIAGAAGRVPTWLAPSGWQGATLVDLLPATIAVISGVAIAHQAATHARKGPVWWSGRLTRRVLVLAAVGLVLHVAVTLPTDLTSLRLTGDLVRLGVAGLLTHLLVRLPERAQLVLASTLLLLHGLVAAGGPRPITPTTTGLAGWDGRLLGPVALSPIDPDGLTALAPTVAAMLLGAAVGRWLLTRPRGPATATRLLAGGVVAAVAARVLTSVVPPIAELWTTPVVLGGVALACVVLGLGHAGTRRAPTDRVVATLAVAGRVTLPLWAVAVLAARWVVTSPPVGWLSDVLLVPPLGRTGASVALGVLAALGLLRLGGALADRDVNLRA